jgi:hypothetical protein
VGSCRQRAAATVLTLLDIPPQPRSEPSYTSFTSANGCQLLEITHRLARRRQAGLEFGKQRPPKQAVCVIQRCKNKMNNRAQRAFLSPWHTLASRSTRQNHHTRHKHVDGGVASMVMISRCHFMLPIKFLWQESHNPSSLGPSKIDLPPCYTPYPRQTQKNVLDLK